MPDSHIEEMLIAAYWRPNRIVYPYAWVGHLPFAFYLVNMLKPAVIVELGTHTGNSFCAFSQAVHDSGNAAECYAVDTWLGDEQAGLYGGEVYEELSSYIANTYGNQSKLRRLTFDEAVAEFKDLSIDLLHIDGLHTYEAVKHDFETWLPKVSNQGVILFHDTEVVERNFGVNMLWQEVSDKYPSFNFRHSHGLGLLCVGEKIAPRLASFIEYAQKHSEDVRRLFATMSLIWLDHEAWEYQVNLPGEKRPGLFQCELFIDVGSGFSEKLKLIKQVSAQADGQCYVEFDISMFQNVKRIRFDPSHGPLCISNMVCISVLSDGRRQDMVIEETRAIVRNDTTLVFANDPFMVFRPEKKCISVVFEYTVRDQGNSCISEVISNIEGRMQSANEQERHCAEALEKAGTNLEKANKSLQDQVEITGSVNHQLDAERIISRKLLQQLEALNENLEIIQAKHEQAVQYISVLRSSLLFRLIVCVFPSLRGGNYSE